MAQILVPPSGTGYDMQYAPHGVTGFEYSGNQYIFAVWGNEGLSTHYDIHVNKSIDGGATWSVTGVIALPVVAAYTICVDGGTAYIMAVGTVGPDINADLCGTLQMWKYNLSTDGITGPTTPTGAPQFYKFWHGATPTDFQIFKCVPIHLVRRGSGDMLLVFSGVPEAIGPNKWARLYVSTFDGTTIGSPVLIAGQAGNALGYTSGAVDVDGSGYLHVCCCPVATGGGGGASKKYLHSAMSPAQSFGSLQEVEATVFFQHLDPPEEMSRLLSWGSVVGFLGVHDDGGDGALYLYTAQAGLTNPSWTGHPVGNMTPVVINPRTTSCVSTSAAFLADNTIHVFWTRNGTTPNWRNADGLGVIQHVSASTADLSTWSAEETVMDYTLVGGTWAAANVNAWSGDTVGIGVFGTFDTGSGPEFGAFLALEGDTSDLTRLVGDTLTLVDHLESTTPRDFAFSDTLTIVDGTPQVNLTTVGGGPGNPPGPGGGGSTPPPGSGMGSCIFEFYEMQTPEDVEVLPTPKKYDQLGPMRFDKIGKIFGFRVRMIVNAPTTVMPYKVYGDDSESDPTLNSIFYQGSFPVRAGIDNVYEIQFPKSVNTDIFRLTLGPVLGSFHRYDVLIKVHTSGMKGQARWMPIR